ncbi:glycosyltransferase family 39 protein, partial [Candidatus Oleimmundimicrobium sp.]|uniref:ArnT family glycosyltransferase n=1 Tax=Candidatus Oleimmundimicrobium sp. TaxID=3060597 RepID=UPI0027172291
MRELVLNRAKIDKILKKDWFWLALIMTASVLFQLYRVGGAFGGFHGCNEAYYASYAKSFLDQPIINILKKSTDFNNPPLFTVFLYISYKLFGVSEVSSRIVPIFFSAVSVYFTYKIGRLLYNKKVALLGAAFLAFCPAFILVGRNVQIESTFIAFTLAALYFYIKSGKENEWKNRIIAGVLLGFGLFSKLPSILIIGAIVIWEIIRNKDFKWIKPSFISFAVLPFIVPLPWILYHIVFSPSSLTGSQTGIFEKVFEIPNVYVIYNIVLKEIFYAISPLLFLLFCC